MSQQWDGCSIRWWQHAATDKDRQTDWGAGWQWETTMIMMCVSMERRCRGEGGPHLWQHVRNTDPDTAAARPMAVEAGQVVTIFMLTQVKYDKIFKTCSICIWNIFKSSQSPLKTNTISILELDHRGHHSLFYYISLYWPPGAGQWKELYILQLCRELSAVSNNNPYDILFFTLSGTTTEEPPAWRPGLWLDWTGLDCCTGRPCKDPGRWTTTSDTGPLPLPAPHAWISLIITFSFYTN